MTRSFSRPTTAPAGRLDAGGQRNNLYTDPDHPSQEWRRLLAEFTGTFALVLVAAGGPVFAAAVPSKAAGTTALVVAPALLIMAMIYTVGDVSGAHFNPAVTFAFALRRDFPWPRVPGYWAAQVAGAVAAAALLRALYGPIGHSGATLPHHGEVRAMIVEALLTFLLVVVIIGTAAGHKLVGHNAALASAGVIALDGLFAAPISGASMNPARSLGPDLVASTMSTYWIYLAGPVTGALVAVLITIAFQGPTPDTAERHAAAGS